MSRQKKGKTRLKKTSSSLSACLLLIAAVYVYNTSESASIPTPRSTSDQCKLHYSHFHLYFTLPPLFFLYFLARPFLTALDWYKLGVLPIIAFVWTTPWDNELVRMGAWWYPSSCVLARIGYVPIEEYAFFVVQSLSTTLLTILLTRWSIPRSGRPTHVAQVLPFASAFIFGISVYTLISDEEGMGSRYYLSMILWWAAVPLTLLWWGTSRSWSICFKNGQTKPWLISLLFSTIYLCCVDTYALKRGTWHISESRSLQRFIGSSLPIEEAIFFLATNTILVSACFTFDRVVWKLRNDDAKHTAPISPVNFHITSWEMVKTIWFAFTKLDVYDRNSKVTSLLEHQQQHSLSILSRASKSFSTAATLLPWDLRIDLGSVYAFARAMDDYIDQPKGIEHDSISRTETLRSIVKTIYREKHPTSTLNDIISTAVHKTQSNGAANGHLHDYRTDIEVSALAAKELNRIIPERLWHELIDGYNTDCTTGPHFTTFEQQADYAQSVAGSIGEMCVRVILARTGVLVDPNYEAVRDINRDSLLSTEVADSTTVQLSQIQQSTSAPSLEPRVIERLLRDARRMGVCLQLINIARDVAKDASELGRCYLVTGQKDIAKLRASLCDNHIEEGDKDLSYDEVEVADLLLETPRISRKVIYAEKLHLLNIADEIYTSCIGTIDSLPCTAARTGLRVACAVYANIGTVIRRRGEDYCLEKCKASTLERIWIALQTIYF